VKSWVYPLTEKDLGIVKEKLEQETEQTERGREWRIRRRRLLYLLMVLLAERSWDCGTSGPTNTPNIWEMKINLSQSIASTCAMLQSSKYSQDRLACRDTELKISPLNSHPFSTISRCENPFADRNTAIRRFAFSILLVDSSNCDL
jgi:hypothetical protein